MAEERERPPRRTRPRDLDENDLVGPRRTEEPPRARRSPSRRAAGDDDEAERPAPRRRAPRPRRPALDDEDELVGPRRMAQQAPRPRRRPAQEEDDEDEIPVPRRLPAPRLRRRARPEAGDRETLKSLIRDIPNFAKLLWRLARDPRVPAVDKALVVAVVAYVVSPFDLIPDIGVLGQIEDIYLLALVMRRLLNNAGIDVLLDHWDGESSSLEAALDALDRAGAVIPERFRGLFGRLRTA